MARTYLTTAVTSTLLFLLATFRKCGGEAELTVELINRTSNQAFIRWSGVELSDVSNCHVAYSIGTLPTDSANYTIYPLNNTVYALNGLLPANKYSLYVDCRDRYNAMHISDAFIIPPAAATTPDFPPPMYPKHPHPYSDGGIHSSDAAPPPEMSEADRGHSSPNDIALGVLLGVVGAGVIIAVAYHLGKRYRRNLRIRRLLQYRQQDSDPFADIDPDSEQ